jgi:hypothetical protein
MTGRVALLGWGSLLWEGGDAFDAAHGPWQYDGPYLKIEFSRVSTSRCGALTLVIDAENGVPVCVAWCLSRRQTISEAIEDLSKRERAKEPNIGWIVAGGAAQCRDAHSLAAIRTWAAKRELDSVVWTDLTSNFTRKLGRPFSVAAALAYLQTLDAKDRATALKYIHCAAAFVRTPLRDALAKLTLQ